MRFVSCVMVPTAVKPRTFIVPMRVVSVDLGRGLRGLARARAWRKRCGWGAVSGGAGVINGGGLARSTGAAVATPVDGETMVVKFTEV